MDGLPTFVIMFLLACGFGFLLRRQRAIAAFTKAVTSDDVAGCEKLATKYDFLRRPQTLEYALYLAIVKNASAVFERILSGGLNVKGEYPRGNSPVLATCALRNRGPMLERLLQAGASPNVRTHEGLTPLHLAARTGSVGLCRALLAAGANSSATTPAGDTPLQLARLGRHPAVVELLEGATTAPDSAVQR